MVAEYRLSSTMQSCITKLDRMTTDTSNGEPPGSTGTLLFLYCIHLMVSLNFQVIWCFTPTLRSVAISFALFILVESVLHPTSWVKPRAACCSPFCLRLYRNTSFFHHRNVVIFSQVVTVWRSSRGRTLGGVDVSHRPATAAH